MSSVLTKSRLTNPRLTNPRWSEEELTLAVDNSYYGFSEQERHGLTSRIVLPANNSAYLNANFSDPLFNIEESKLMLMDHNRPSNQIGIFSEPEDYVSELIWIMSQPENFGMTVKLLFNVDLAPFQIFILQELWRRKFPMLLATRGGGKTYLLSLYAMLKAIIEQGSQIVIVGGAFRQSKFLFEYMETFWRDAPLIRHLVGHGKKQGPKRDIDRCCFYLGDSVITCIPLGDGCLYTNTLTLSNDCFSTISQPHKAIWGNGQYRLSDKHYDNGIRLTKIVKTKKGFSYEGTNNHRMKIVRDGIVEWARTDEMVVGDKILIDRSRRWHNGNFECTDAQAYLLGCMIGDGSWTNKSNLGFATIDHDHFSYYLEQMDSKWKKLVDDQHWGLYGKLQHSKWIEFWNLKDLCYTKDKELPSTILSASRENVVACLSGLFDSDGCMQIGIAKGGIAITVSFTNTSKRLVEQIQFILLHFGIISYVTSRDRNEKWNTVYELLITGKDSVLFIEQIGFRLPRKQQPLLAAIANKKRSISAGDCIPDVRLEMMRIAKNNRVRRGTDVITNVTAAKIARRKEITYDYAQDFLQKYGHIDDPFMDKIRQLVDPNIYYDTITSIQDSKCQTYDMHVPDGHEYCAGGFFSHNSKIRGLRAHYTIADEFDSIAVAIFEIVIRGFGSVSAAPTQRARQMELIKVLGGVGRDDEAEEEKGLLGFGNQTIVSGTAGYSFYHFYSYYKRYQEIIKSRGDPKILEEIFNGETPDGFDWKQYSIICASYQRLPYGFMDETQIAQMRATMLRSSFEMEYLAVFADDSDGFFRRLLIESCVTNKHIETPTSGPVKFSCLLHGDKRKKYIYGIDPASEADNFAIIVLECYGDHRRIVYSWTINRQELRQQMKNKGKVQNRSFYVFCARKIRDLMKIFPTEHIAIDSQGGGHTIAETLRDVNELEKGEMPLLPYVKNGAEDDFWWEKDKKPTDGDAGLHILHIVNFADAKFIYESNHGLRKDMESKQLLFPYFDSISLAIASTDDKIIGREDDTLEDTMMEIEDLKDELSTIIHTQTMTTGRDQWDTPATKLPGGKKGRLRKDRYSALLIANMVARVMIKESLKTHYESAGGYVGQKRDKPTSNTLYVGPDNLVSKMTGTYGVGVIRR